MMRASVALCTYNGARFLREQLQSIADQTVKPAQVVICDDGSRDDTLSIAHQFRFEIHTTDRRLGTVANFDRAIALCNGDIIFLADQDDVWHRDKVKQTLERFDDLRVQCVFTNARLIDENGTPLGGTLWQHIGLRGARVPSPALFNVLANTNVATGATMAFRSSLRSLIQPLPSDQPHDWWIALLAAATNGLAAIDEPLIDYRLHPRQQAGAGPQTGSVDVWLDAAMRTGPRVFEERARRLELVRDRLASRGIAVDLDARIAHFRTRASMRGAMRPLLVAREMLNGRYFRYSRHFISAAKDLFGVASGY